MSDEGYLSETTFRTGVFGALLSGVTLYAYKNFFAKRSFMVKYKAYTCSKDETLGRSVIDEQTLIDGTLVYQVRPMFSMSHDDIVSAVFEHIKKMERFQNVPDESINVEIEKVHIM